MTDLLNVARADSGRMVLDRRPTDLGAMLADIVKEQSGTITSRKQSIELEAGPLEANIDPSRLRMAIENLVNNASKYTPDGGKLRVCLVDRKSTIEIAIKDNGVGIAPQDIEKVFVKFTRLDNSLSRERGGTGLGMYLVKSIIDLHGGTINAKSEVGKGTEFTLVLPK